MVLIQGSQSCLIGEMSDDAHHVGVNDHLPGLQWGLGRVIAVVQGHQFHHVTAHATGCVALSHRQLDGVEYIVAQMPVETLERSHQADLYHRAGTPQPGATAEQTSQNEK